MTSLELLMEALAVSKQSTPEIMARAERLRQLELEVARRQGIEEGISIMRSMLNPNTTGNEQ